MKEIPCPLVDRIKIMKIGILPKSFYRFNVIFIIVPMACFTELGRKTIRRFIWDTKDYK